MTRKLLLGVLALFLCQSLFAGKVTEQEALQKAQQFMQGKTFQKKSLRRAQQNASMDGAFYIFNAESNGGFVIVSADDRTEAILAYADQGYFDTSAMPENVRKWLEGYADQIKALGNSEVKSVPRRTDKAAVEPLITCHWNQGSPYNLWCPADGENRSVTGCTATAMAQIMYYHQWPKDATAAIPSYTTKKKGFEMEELPATVFKWDKMKDEYKYDETGEAAEAVAELMLYCGQAVEMDYSASGSGGSVNASTMINYFGYSKTAKIVYRWYYSTYDWEDMIYKEVYNHRPVWYTGFNISSGHAFVIDGYDGNGLFHVNWGWGGSSDGYFLLSVLNPDGRGIGGGSSSDGYSSDQRALIGLQPDHGEEAVLPLVYCDMFLSENMEYTRTSSDEDFDDVQINAGLYHWSNPDDDVLVDHSWVLYHHGEPVQVLNVQNEVTVSFAMYSYVDATVTFGAGLDDGTYEIRSRVRKTGTEDWESACVTNSWVVVISGNTATLMKVSEIPGALQINNINLDGAPKTYRDMTITINLTNNGFDCEQIFYVWLEGKSKAVAKGTAYLDNGQTGDLLLTFQPETAGDIMVKITTDSEGNNVVWSESMTIEQSLPYTLTGEVAIDGERNYTIEGTTINATFTIKNEGENAYDDEVIISLVPIDENGNWNYNGEITEVRNLKLAVGEEKELIATFPDLTEGQEYFLGLQYYSYYPDYNRVYEDWAAYTYCTVGTVLVAYDMNFSINATNADANNIIEGTTIKADIAITNNSDYDYDDVISLHFYYYNGANYSWEKSQEFRVQVPARQTIIKKDYEITDLTIGRQYGIIAVGYKSENQFEYDWLYPNPDYTLVEPTAIRDVEIGANEVIGIYTLDGQRIDTYRKGVNIVKMANGRTRKVVVK